MIQRHGSIISSEQGRAEDGPLRWWRPEKGIYPGFRASQSRGCWPHPPTDSPRADRIRSDQRRPMTNPAIEVARRIAERAHDGQVDKAGAPYIEHPAMAADLV
jgi:hypothetical protein